MISRKNAIIDEVLARLDLPSNKWKVVDHWEADQCALGVAREDDHHRLVYFSIFGRKPRHFYYECEVAGTLAGDEYQTLSTGEATSVEELVGIIAHHLDVDD